MRGDNVPGRVSLPDMPPSLSATLAAFRDLKSQNAIDAALPHALSYAGLHPGFRRSEDLKEVAQQ